MMDEPISEREKYFVAFFKDQPDYYLNEYRHQYVGRKWSFNIGAFFFGAFWFIYRKMYLLALVLFVISIISSQVQLYIFSHYEVNFEIKKAAVFVVPTIWAFVSGFIGNYFYAKFATTKVESVLQTHQTEETRLEILKQQGGTTKLAFLVAALLMLFYMMIAGH